MPHSPNSCVPSPALEDSGTLSRALAGSLGEGRGRRSSFAILCALCLLSLTTAALAQRQVTFPPAESKPPPPMKEPPKTENSGEETGILPDYGPTQRKTQGRTPPPPTTLTVMYKVEYGETLSYTHADGTVQKFEQWKSYPNDAYNLVTYANQQLGDGNNYVYATKPLASEGFDPIDIPILFMAGDYEFVLTDKEVENLRKFLTGGGTIIFNAARGRDEFSLSVVREMRKVFPSKTFMKMPLDHPVFNCKYRIKEVTTMINGVQASQPPEIYSIDIGTRGAAILIPSGMGAAWSGTEYHPAGKHIISQSAVRLGVNLIAYVLGSTEYGRFLAQEFPRYNGHTRPGDVVRCALVKYAGSWDDNPAIQNSLLQALNENTNIPVDYTPTSVTLDDPALGDHPLVFMTGHYDFQLTPEEQRGLQGYLRRGGMLVASAAAGLKPFDIAFRRELRKALPEASLIKLPPTHPLFLSGWTPIDKVAYSETARRDNPLLETPEFYGLFMDDRLVVLYTPYDLMSGVNRESNAYAKGITGEDATRVALNIITYTLSH